MNFPNREKKDSEGPTVRIQRGVFKKLIIRTAAKRTIEPEEFLEKKRA